MAEMGTRIIGSQVWLWFVVLGLLFGAVSLMVVDVLVSALLGVSGARATERVSARFH